MLFTSRHEQELAEIKALSRELDRRVKEGLGQLERIEESQDKALGRAGGRRTRAARQPAIPNMRQASAVVEGNGSEPLLVFVHVPKTAGATVITMLAAAYSREAVRDAGNYVRNPERTATKLAMSSKSEGRVLAGHVPYAVFREYLPDDARYMTFLREPVDRVLSHYYRHRARKEGRRAQPGRISPGGKITTRSIEEALAEPPLTQLSNLATRFLCAHPSPPEKLPASALDDAKENLREFAFVGVQERFEESLVLLQRMLGLGLVPYENRHVSSTGRADRPAVDEIPEEQRALIEEYNALDAELYRFGLGLFEDAIAATEDGFAPDVEALRAWAPTRVDETGGV